MRRLTRFLALPAEDRRAFAVSIALLCVVRLSLWIVPFRWLRSAVGRVAPPPDGTPNPTPGEAERTVQAIESAARSVPGATCLTQALAAELLLRRAGHPAAIASASRRRQAGSSRRTPGSRRTDAYCSAIMTSITTPGFIRSAGTSSTLIPGIRAHRRELDLAVGGFSARGTSTAAPLRLSRSKKASVDLLTGVPTGAPSGAMEAWRSAPCYLGSRPSPMRRSSPSWVPLARSPSSTGASTTARISSRSSGTWTTDEALVA